jgi:hypothetical protein
MATVSETASLVQHHDAEAGDAALPVRVFQPMPPQVTPSQPASVSA